MLESEGGSDTKKERRGESRAKKMASREAYLLRPFDAGTVYLDASNSAQHYKAENGFDERSVRYANTLRSALVGELLLPLVKAEPAWQAAALTRTAVDSLHDSAGAVVRSEAYRSRAPFSFPPPLSEIPIDVYDFANAKGLGEGAF